MMDAIFAGEQAESGNRSNEHMERLSGHLSECQQWATESKRENVRSLLG